MSTFNWVCPYCDHAQSVGDDKFKYYHQHIYIDDLAEGQIGFLLSATGCSNDECKRVTINASIRPEIKKKNSYDYLINHDANPLYSKRLLPRSDAKPQPEFIPEALREDYLEACLIKEDSPKAAATLARRCLQGMIRDFCGIKKATLHQEIKALQEAVYDGTAPRGVSAESVEAIDHVRRVGNVGAHMEENIDLIIPVDSGEAQALIGLIELLFEEWYVAKEQRNRRLATIAAISAEKQQAIIDARSASQPDPSNETTDGPQN